MKGLLLTILMLSASLVSAQDKYFFFAVDIAKPLTNTTWIGSSSAYGVKVGYRAFINEKFSAGLDLGSNTFEQYSPTETHYNGNGAITTDYFKYIYSYSATLNGQYYLIGGDEERFFPYVGLGLGANHNQYSLYYNRYEDGDKGWGFLARPEAGILVKIGRGSLGAIAAVHYDYSTNKSENFNYSNFSAIGVQIGVMLIDR